MFTEHTATVVATAIIGAIIWFVRLEGRVDGHEKACDERMKRLDERHSSIELALGSINRKLDSVLEERRHE